MFVRFITCAVCYLLIGVWMGLIMGISQQFQFAPVHAHINLLGWVSLALIGLIYRAYPQAAATRLALWHFWLHNIGLPVFMLGLYLLLSGYAQAKMAVIAGAMVTVVAVTLFVINLLRTAASESFAARPERVEAPAMAVQPRG